MLPVDGRQCLATYEIFLNPNGSYSYRRTCSACNTREVGTGQTTMPVNRETAHRLANIQRALTCSTGGCPRYARQGR